MARQSGRYWMKACSASQHASWSIEVLQSVILVLRCVRHGLFVPSAHAGTLPCKVRPDAGSFVVYPLLVAFDEAQRKGQSWFRFIVFRFVLALSNKVSPTISVLSVTNYFYYTKILLVSSFFLGYTILLGCFVDAMSAAFLQWFALHCWFRKWNVDFVFSAHALLYLWCTDTLWVSLSLEIPTLNDCTSTIQEVPSSRGCSIF